MSAFSRPESDTNTARFSYKKELKRGASRLASFTVSVAFVTIAAGIFNTYGFVLNASGPAGTR